MGPVSPTYEAVNVFCRERITVWITLETKNPNYRDLAFAGRRK